MKYDVARITATAGLAIGTAAYAQNTPEIEPNETRPTSTLTVTAMDPGHTLTGNSTGTATTAGATSLDQFRVKTSLTAPGIYRYRLVITSAIAGHTGTIRALTQTAAAQAVWPGAVGTATTTDTAFQTSSTATTPPRFNQWYGFGKGEEIYYRVTGSTTTTADYTCTLERLAVTPTNVGTFAPGTITLSSFSQGHTTDTEFWVYDGNFNAMDGYGNDDEATAAISGVAGTAGTTLQSVLKRTYTPGVYYIALSNFAMSNNKASPCDDDFRTGAILDFPDAIANSNTTVGLNMLFTISDGVTTTPVANSKVGAFDINWFTFTVSGGGCYPNCDGSSGNPLLTANDFQCFINKFAGNDSYANCDGSTGIPALTANDFQCFINKYAGGCS